MVLEQNLLKILRLSKRCPFQYLPVLQRRIWAFRYHTVFEKESGVILGEFNYRQMYFSIPSIKNYYQLVCFETVPIYYHTVLEVRV